MTSRTGTGFPGCPLPAEYEAAQRMGGDVKDVWARWGQDRANTVKSQAQEVADTQHDIDVQIEQAKTPSPSAAWPAVWRNSR